MNDQHDPLAALTLPPAVSAQAAKLLQRIAQAQPVSDLWISAHRAEGFVLGLETVKALNAADIEALYLVFERAATLRRSELQG